ncbi:MAG: type I methionyl aminopeptidase [Chloroflexota bacterium]
MIKRHSKVEIAKMRSAGRIVAEVLALVEETLTPGISTTELDRIAERHIRSAGGVPSFLGYLGGRKYDARDPHAYKASTCISIDHEIVHGIPGDRVIAAGQVVSVDVGAIYDGWHGDGARTFICGGQDAGTPHARQLVDTTRLSLMAGIAAAVPGAHLGDIGGAVEDVAVAGGYGIVRGYTGHGIGTSMHEDPSVPNFRTGRPGIKLEPGLCLAIEPMLMIGDERTRVMPDGWTVVTADGSLAAHFEHTIAITAEGPEILTRV